MGVCIGECNDPGVVHMWASGKILWELAISFPYICPRRIFLIMSLYGEYFILWATTLAQDLRFDTLTPLFVHPLLSDFEFDGTSWLPTPVTVVNFPPWLNISPWSMNRLKSSLLQLLHVRYSVVAVRKETNMLMYFQCCDFWTMRKFPILLLHLFP